MPGSTPYAFRSFLDPIHWHHSLHITLPTRAANNSNIGLNLVPTEPYHTIPPNSTLSIRPRIASSKTRRTPSWTLTLASGFRPVSGSISSNPLQETLCPLQAKTRIRIDLPDLTKHFTGYCCRSCLLAIAEGPITDKSGAPSFSPTRLGSQLVNAPPTDEKLRNSPMSGCKWR